MSYKPIVVYKNRTNVVSVKLGIDVSADTFTSQIRQKEDVNSLLLATWTVTFATNGVDGDLILRLDDSLTSNILVTTGFMDLKRIASGEPIPVFSRPLPVTFVEAITA